MEEKEDINALDEINKGACMGIDAIGFIIEKVSNQKLKKILEKQSSMYKEINEEIESIYPKYNEECPHETTAINKMMTSGTINMKLINNQSNSKLAELLIEGTNMGIIEGRKILNNKKLNSEVKDIVDRYVGVQEKYLECLKEFL